MTSTTPAGTQAVDRAAALIDLVVRADEPLSFTELSEETGLARSTTSRLLAALERTELVERDAAGGYVAGPLFALYAALPRPVAAGGPAGPADAGDGRRAHRRDRAPRRRPRPPGSCTSARSSRPSCCRRATGTRSTYPRTARRSARCSRLRACCPVPAGRLERSPPATPSAPARSCARELRDGPPPRLRGHPRRARGRAHRYRRARCGGDDGVVAAIGISGPTARLQDRLDRIGRLLVEQRRRRCRPCCARQDPHSTTPPAGGRGMTTRRDPAGALRRDAASATPPGARAHPPGARAGDGAADACSSTR